MTKYLFVIFSLTYTLLQQATALQVSKEHFLQNLLQSNNTEFSLSCNSKEPLKKVTFEFDNEDYMHKTKYKAADGTDRILPLSNMYRTKRYHGMASIGGCDENGKIPLRNIQLSVTRTFYTDEEREELKKFQMPALSKIKQQHTTYLIQELSASRKRTQPINMDVAGAGDGILIKQKHC